MERNSVKCLQLLLTNVPQPLKNKLLARRGKAKPQALTIELVANQYFKFQVTAE